MTWISLHWQVSTVHYRILTNTMASFQRTNHNPLSASTSSLSACLQVDLTRTMIKIRNVHYVVTKILYLCQLLPFWPFPPTLQCSRSHHPLSIRFVAKLFNTFTTVQAASSSACLTNVCASSLWPSICSDAQKYPSATVYPNLQPLCRWVENDGVYFFF